uniref:Ephrin RBD domain-containing protein n=1 Tax=Loa loa TaxID=7209 RepID=A0A1I7W451_LOALO
MWEEVNVQQPFPYRGKSFFTITPPPPHPWDSWDFGYKGGYRVAGCIRVYVAGVLKQKQFGQNCEVTTPLSVVLAKLSHCLTTECTTTRRYVWPLNPVLTMRIAN